MEIVKAFNSNSLHVNILIKGTIENPLFRANDIGNILEIINIKQNIKDFEEDEKTILEINTQGGTQNSNFLTEKGLYKILFKSRKPIADQFQNWVCDIVKEIRLKGYYELQQEIDTKTIQTQTLQNKNKELEYNLKNTTFLEKEKLLLKQFEKEDSIVYIIKIKTIENGQYIVKIGESRKGISSRYDAHKKNYDECVLLDCFSVNKSGNFEKFLHSHPKIKPSKYTTLLKHETENELFLIGKDLTYKMVQDIINENLNKYNYNTQDVREILEELKLVKKENYSLKNEIISLKNTINNTLRENPESYNSMILPSLTNDTLLLELKNQIENLSNTIKTNNLLIIEKLNNNKTEDIITHPTVKTTTGFNIQLSTIGPRLQKINPENLTLIQVYESVTEAMNENKNIKRPSIMKAITDNTIYCGYRWQLVERNLDPNIINDLYQTVEIQQQNVGYIAKLNSEKNSILNVYLDRKTAAKINNYKSISALDNPVKNGTITNENYYILYDKCEKELIDDFEKRNNGPPLLYKNGVGKFDKNENLFQEFACKYDCIRTLKISDKTLNKALENNILYNEFYYKELGSRLFL